MKYTPGPWEAKKLLCDGKIVNKEGWEIHTPGYDVCTLVFVGAPIRKEADACLIAAAPELLEACKLVPPLLEQLRGFANDAFGGPSSVTDCIDLVLSEINAAIAKAEGKDNEL